MLARLSVCIEVILIDPRQPDNAIVAYADTVLDHQRREPSAVNENDAICHLGGEFPRLTGEGGRGDQDALPRTPACESSVEPLHLRATDGTLQRFA